LVIQQSEAEGWRACDVTDVDDNYHVIS
jgi:hypothetical protein